MKEIWKPVSGFDGYEVSNLGRVKGPNKELSPSYGKTRYLHVILYRNGKRHTKNVHRLVAEAFVPNPEHLPIVNHIDEICDNNNADNLEWCCQKYNINYGTRTKRMAKTKSKPVVATLPDGTQEHYTSVNEVYRVLKTHISPVLNTDKVRKGRTWKTE